MREVQEVVYMVILKLQVNTKKKGNSTLNVCVTLHGRSCSKLLKTVCVYLWIHWIGQFYIWYRQYQIL